jgi:hypothetical protein
MAAAAVLLTAAGPQSWAWGRAGHRLTALVAEQYLTPATQAAIKELLGTETLAGVSTWADEYRVQHPETAPWHFADIPKDQATYDRTRDCPAAADPNVKWRDCVTDRITYFELQLADTKLPREQRYQALKYLVHFIGDIHQPLHAIGDARGGNGIRVTFLGSSQCGSYNCNLHGVWDDSMIEHHNLSEAKYVAFLLTDIREHDWEKRAGGTPIQWVNASHQYAVNAFAPNGALIGKDYVEEESRVVDSQLALGGLRLARVLNSILGHESVPPMPAATTPRAEERKALPKP